MAARSPLTFLDLPTPIRHRIYEEAGLVRPCPIDLRHEKRSRARRQQHETLRTRLPAGDPSLPTCPTRLRAADRHATPELIDAQCVCPALPTGLLFVSRAVHADAAAVLYGRNAFRLAVDRHPQALGALHRLGDGALRALASLHVCLTAWPCPRGHDAPMGWRRCRICQAPARPDECRAYGERGTDADRYLLSAWYTVVKRLKAHLVPGRVRWSFVCDCATLAHARHVARLLRDLPRAREAAVRLGRDSDDAPGAELARDAARWMVHRRASGGGAVFPRFPDLPRELRLQVLAATGLAAASRAPYYFAFQRVTVANGRFVVSHRDCCARCTRTLEPCCCPTRYAASSETCQCVPPPEDLLAVSRAMRADTYEVLLSANVIAFVGAPDVTLRTLRALPRDVLRHFRRVRLELDYRAHITSWSAQSLDAPWRALIDFIRHNFNLARLGLAVNQSNSFQELLEHEDPAESRPTYDVYVRSLLPPLQALRGLRSFHVRLGWFRDLERPVEEVVMGPEYDSWEDTFFPKDRLSFDCAWPIPEGWATEEEQPPALGGV